MNPDHTHFLFFPGLTPTFQTCPALKKNRGRRSMIKLPVSTPFRKAESFLAHTPTRSHQTIVESCELAHIIKLSCSDTLINNIVVYLATFIFGGLPFWGIILSYVQIVYSVLKKPSVRGSYKALSTCGSHLSVVSLFYGSVIGVYISFAVTDSSRKAAVASVLYTVVPQMLNPFVYSLRNKDMKEAVRKLCGGIL